MAHLATVEARVHHVTGRSDGYRRRAATAERIAPTAWWPGLSAPDLAKVALMERRLAGSAPVEV